MIFVTVGSSDLPFDRLVRDAGAVAADEAMIVQRGASRVRPAHGVCVDFMSFDEVIAHMRAARVVVTHAGVGSIMSALTAGKRPVVVPRLRRLREAPDDHQVELGRRLRSLELVTLAETPPELARAVREPCRDAVYASGNGDLARDLEQFLRTCCA